MFVRGARLVACLVVCATVAATFSGCDRLVFGAKAREARVLGVVRQSAASWNAYHFERVPANKRVSVDQPQLDVAHAFVARRWTSPPLLQTEFFEVKVPGVRLLMPDTLTYLAALDVRGLPVLLSRPTSDRWQPQWPIQGPDHSYLPVSRTWLGFNALNSVIAAENIAPVDTAEAVGLARLCAEIGHVLACNPKPSYTRLGPVVLDVPPDVKTDSLGYLITIHAQSAALGEVDWVTSVSRQGVLRFGVRPSDAK